MRWRGRLPLAMASAAFLLGVMLTALERQVVHRACPRGSGEACPSGTESDRPRAARVRGLLALTARGRQLRQQAARVHELCFGPPERSALVGRGDAAVLDATLGDAENAARLGHLLSHATALAALPDVDRSLPSCDAFVEAAIRAEERAHAIERDLRAELGAAGRRAAHPFGAPSPAPMGAAQASSANGVTLERFDAAASLGALARGYRAQCEAARLARAKAE